MTTLHGKPIGCWRACALGLFLLLEAMPVVAFDTSRIEDPDVRACADRALPSDTASQIQKVEVVDKQGFVRESRRSVVWKRDLAGESRVLVRVLEPPDERGLAVLISDDSRNGTVTFMSYSPRLKRVRRVSAASFSGSVLGTDFSYEDFQSFYRVDQREQVERVADSSIDGQPVYVLESVKPDDHSQYALVRFHIDQALCLPLRTEFLAPIGELRKVLVVAREEAREVDGKWVPFRTTMFDRKHGTHTVFLVEEVAIDPPLDAGLFEVAALVRDH